MDEPIDTPPEFPEVLRAFRLGRAHRSRFLAEGLMNRNWRIETDEGAFALKELVDVAAPVARRNLAVLPRLAAMGLPVAAPRAGQDGELVVEVGDRSFYLFPWLEGARILGAELSNDQAEGLGRLLAELHLGLNDPATGLPEPEAVTAAIVTADAAEAKIHYFTSIIESQGLRSDFDRMALGVLQRRHQLLNARRGSQPLEDTPTFPASWIHGDFTSSNLLWDASCVVGILDWDRLRARPAVEEIARTAILHFKHDDGRIDLERIARFTAGYRSVAEISAESLSDALKRLWWHHLTSFWILGFHYGRAVSSSDYLLVPRENLLGWWTEHFDAVCSAFISVLR